MTKDIVFKDIALNDKDIICEYLKRYPVGTSDMTFTNLYMWRQCYKSQYSIVGDFLLVANFADVAKLGTPLIYAPVGPCSDVGRFSELIYKLKQYFFGSAKLVFSRVPEQQLECFYRAGATKEDVVFDANNSDYIYKTYDLIHLPGKRYHGKRNHINDFKRQHKFEYVRITLPEHIDECLKINDMWCESRGHDCLSAEYCEKTANYELLSNFDALGCIGALLKVDGVYSAFTVGEKIDDSMAVIHIEKADSNLRGLYPLINQQFCEHEWSQCEFTNREQDLGIEGLRRAKLSYKPVRLLNKYTISL